MLIGFLGYDRTQTRLIAALEKEGCAVDQSAAPVRDLSSYDLVVSFGFKHILRPAVLDTARRPALNLHISHLPYNRGYHPNFWAHMERTPHGVSIHEIDAGIDTGAIVRQREVRFEPDLDTFSATYLRLIGAIEDLFIDSLEAVLSGAYVARPQEEAGTFHLKSDLPSWMTDWTMRIDEARELFQAQTG